MLKVGQDGRLNGVDLAGACRELDAIDGDVREGRGAEQGLDHEAKSHATHHVELDGQPLVGARAVSRPDGRAFRILQAAALELHTQRGASVPIQIVPEGQASTRLQGRRVERTAHARSLAVALDRLGGVQKDGGEKVSVTAM